MFIPKIKKNLNFLFDFVKDEKGSTSAKQVVNIGLLVMLIDGVMADTNIYSFDVSKIAGGCQGMEMGAGDSLDQATGGELYSEPQIPAATTCTHRPYNSCMYASMHGETNYLTFHSNNLGFDDLGEKYEISHHNCTQVVRKSWWHHNHKNGDGGFLGGLF